MDENTHEKPAAPVVAADAKVNDPALAIGAWCRYCGTFANLQSAGLVGWCPVCARQVLYVAAKPDQATKPPAAVTTDEARRLVAVAMDLERRSVGAELQELDAHRVWEERSRAASVAKRQAAKAWAVARLAQRACARGEAMPANAGEVQLQLEPDFVAPEGAKHGDKVRDPVSGRLYQIHETKDGGIYAFPV